MTTIGSGLAGAGFALLLILVFQIVLVKAARKGTAGQPMTRVVTLMDLIITSEDESYSLSRLQIYLWTVAIMVGFSAVFWATGEIPGISTNLCLLMGVNATAAVASTALNTIQTNGPAVKPLGKAPDFIRDIFFDTPDSIDLPRTQMFIWTIVSLVVFIVSVGLMFKKNDFSPETTPAAVQSAALPTGAPPTTAPSKKPSPSLPDIPVGLVLLMGISHGAYLGAKAAASKTAVAQAPAPAPVNPPSPPA